MLISIIHKDANLLLELLPLHPEINKTNIYEARFIPGT